MNSIINLDSKSNKKLRKIYAKYLTEIRIINQV